VSKFAKLDANFNISASAGAVLIVKFDGRIFGCCFGSSVSNINRGAIETDFGLAAAFERMLRNQTKTIGSFTLSSNPVSNTRTSAMPTAKTNFNINEAIENITELSGFLISKDTKKRNLVKGKEFYSSPLPNSLKKN
jgi:uncharacterized protein (TIGR04141 family)